MPNPALMEVKSHKADLVTDITDDAPIAETSGKEILEQVKTGILKKLDSDESRFIVRLKPEGLGEIAVDMVQKSGKIVLNIIASSSQTEKLLASELTGLRDSLRLYNAEIKQVTSTETDPSALSYFSDRNFTENSEGRLDQWRYAEEQQSYGALTGGSDSVRDENRTEAVLQSRNSLLNRYV
jgi:hypothetical protein